MIGVVGALTVGGLSAGVLLAKFIVGNNKVTPKLINPYADEDRFANSLRENPLDDLSNKELRGIIDIRLSRKKH